MRVIPYRKVSDLDALLKARIIESRDAACNVSAAFVVPSRRDRDWWKLRARTGDASIDARFADNALLWNWEDVYNDIRAALGRQKLRQIDPPDHRLILSFIVSELLGEDEYGGLLSVWPGLSRPGFIDILADDLRELINEAVSPEQLCALSRDDPTSAVLPELYRRYTAYLDANNLMDSSQIPLKTLETLDDRSNKNTKKMIEKWIDERIFTFVGFMSFTGGQLALVRKIESLSPRDVVVFKPVTDLDDFQDATKQLEGVTWEKEPPPSGGTVISLLSSESNLEPEMIARLLALWREGEGELYRNARSFPGFGAVGLSVTSSRLLPMEAALRRYRIPYVLARGRSVSKNILGTNLNSIWTAWTEGLETRETALLLSQPWAGVAVTKSDPGFSVEDAERAGPYGVKAWENYLKQAGAKSAHAAFKAIVKFCRALEKGASPEGILGALHDFLTTRGLWVSALLDTLVDYPALDESLRELSASVAEVEDKRSAMRELQPDLGPAGGLAVKGKTAMRFLNDWCDDTLVSPSPPVLGALTLYVGPPPILASYPVWIMTDVTQKAWPGVIRSSPLLDESGREMIATDAAWLPSIHDKRVQKEALFRRLLQTGDELTVISRSSFDDDGHPTIPAGFLDSFFDDLEGWTLKDDIPVFGMSALSPGDVYFHDIETSGGGGRVENLILTPVLRAVESNLSLPVSDIHELLSCPMRWWLSRRARVQTVGRELFSNSEAGSMTHKIWENILLAMAESGGKETMRDAADAEWKRALSLANDDYAPYWRILKDYRLERHRKNIEFYIARLARFQDRISERLDASCAAGQTPLRSECRPEFDLTPREVDGVRFTGRCDRMDIFEDGSVVILDYKLGRSESYEKKRPASVAHLGKAMEKSGVTRDKFKYGLQLSAYALLRDLSSDTEARVVGVGFLGHKDGGLSGTFEPPFDSCYFCKNAKGASLSERAEEARDAMKCAAVILKSGVFEPNYDSESCKYCDFKGVCRKGEIRGERTSSEDDENGGDKEEEQ
ncbi:hypothetical protein FACS1894187_16390 [Synergistales bacterium]|nr:hypothetical protein FACS1894187_16390 [Synergistales bacterium]